MESESPQIKLPELTEVENEPTSEFPYSAVVVCGAAYSGSRHGISPLGLQRVFAAYHAYKLGLAPYIVLTGGPKWDAETSQYSEEKDIQPPEYEEISEEMLPEEREQAELTNKKRSRENRQHHSETIPNSVLMKRILIERLNVPKGDILCDELSVTTTDNFAEALNILEKAGLPTDNFLVISDGFHIERVMAESSRYSKKFTPMATETSLLLRSLALADKRKKTDQEQRYETGETSQEIEERYEQTLSRWKDVYEGRWGGSPEAKAKTVADDVRGLPETQKVWSVWGPHTLTINDTEKLEEFLDLGLNEQYNKSYSKWKRYICKRTGLPSNISDQELKEMIMSRKISPLALRASRVKWDTGPLIKAKEKLTKEIIKNPELRKQYVDISGTILSLYHQPELLKQFLDSPYGAEVDEWRLRHELELGQFDSYESLCSALLNTKIERDKIAQSREKMADPDRRKSEIANE